MQLEMAPFPVVPPVRILCLLVVITGVASARVPLMLTGGALIGLLGVWLIISPFEFKWRDLVAMMRRIRWLLVAIFVLYLGFTPGESLAPEINLWLPSIEGVQQGALRVAVLLAIITAVHLLLVTTPRGELLAGLLWYGRPARRLGLDDSRFAVRLVLALEAVPKVQDLVSAAVAETTGRSRLERLACTGDRVMVQVLQQADAGAGTLHLPDQAPVPLWQWLIPIMIIVLFAVALYL